MIQDGITMLNLAQSLKLILSFWQDAFSVMSCATKQLTVPALAWRTSPNSPTNYEVFAVRSAGCSVKILIGFVGRGSIRELCRSGPRFVGTPREFAPKTPRSPFRELLWAGFVRSEPRTSSA